MANKPVKKNIEKALFDNSSFKNLGLSGETVKEKEVHGFHLKAFHCNRFARCSRGYTSQFRGFSDVGKSTGIYETLAGAQN
jgi:hypothetical protein